MKWCQWRNVKLPYPISAKTIVKAVSTSNQTPSSIPSTDSRPSGFISSVTPPLPPSLGFASYNDAALGWVRCRECSPLPVAQCETPLQNSPPRYSRLLSAPATPRSSAVPRTRPPIDQASSPPLSLRFCAQKPPGTASSSLRTSYARAVGSLASRGYENCLKLGLAYHYLAQQPWEIEEMGNTKVHAGVISPPEVGEEGSLDRLWKLDILGSGDFFTLMVLPRDM